MINIAELNALCTRLEEEFKETVNPKMPWQSRENPFHSIFKILYMQLCSMEFHGYANIERSCSGLSFCGIVYVNIPQEHRGVFDMSPVPSLCGLDAQISQETGERKILLQTLRDEYAVVWKSYGFNEYVDASGNLVFVFSPDNVCFSDVNVLRHFVWSEDVEGQSSVPDDVACGRHSNEV